MQKQQDTHPPGPLDYAYLFISTVKNLESILRKSVELRTDDGKLIGYKLPAREVEKIRSKYRLLVRSGDQDGHRA